MTAHAAYVLTFSMQRLRALFEGSGTVLYVSPELEDALVRIVAEIARGEVWLEIKRTGQDWEAASSVLTAEEVVTPKGRYL